MKKILISIIIVLCAANIYLLVHISNESKKRIEFQEENIRMEGYITGYRDCVFDHIDTLKSK